MPATERDEALPRVVSMHDLLAACAAADVISKPPRESEPRRPEPGEDQPEAA
ncbi:hypothetical protein [Streptomyces luteolifulvus]|jgi:hypothetical protein|uniref:hypothetical protein n=1 Tax=Streptomyces luteolifulvus TaxID=2615112 RepID=UPI00177EC6EB|nr:hypothetical protein [Streptomyces luteolifulvus]